MYGDEVKADVAINFWRKLWFSDIENIIYVFYPLSKWFFMKTI